LENFFRNYQKLSVTIALENIIFTRRVVHVEVYTRVGTITFFMIRYVYDTYRNTFTTADVTRSSNQMKVRVVTESD